MSLFSYYPQILFSIIIYSKPIIFKHSKHKQHNIQTLYNYSFLPIFPIFSLLLALHQPCQLKNTLSLSYLHHLILILNEINLLRFPQPFCILLLIINSSIFLHLFRNNRLIVPVILIVQTQIITSRWLIIVLITSVNPKTKPWNLLYLVSSQIKVNTFPKISFPPFISKIIFSQKHITFIIFFIWLYFSLSFRKNKCFVKFCKLLVIKIRHLIKHTFAISESTTTSSDPCSSSFSGIHNNTIYFLFVVDFTNKW